MSEKKKVSLKKVFVISLLVCITFVAGFYAGIATTVTHLEKEYYVMSEEGAQLLYRIGQIDVICDEELVESIDEDTKNSCLTLYSILEGDEFADIRHIRNSANE